VIDCFPDGVSSGELLLELGFADATEEETIPLEVLGLILGGDDDLKAEARVVVGHFFCAFVSVAVSGDGERIANDPWDVKFILPNNKNIFEPIN